MIKMIIFPLLILTILVGCAPKSTPATLESGCNAPGNVERGNIAETTRGYPYRYMIYTPPCYNEIAEPGYPIIYLVPGRGGGPIHWFNAGVNEIADQLILNGEISPFIIVSAETTDVDPDATAISGDLIPYIESNYNVLANRAHRAIGGGSLGGIAAYRLAFRYPDEFASAGMFGCGVVNGEDDRVRGWLAEMESDNRTRVFLNTGEDDPLMLDQTKVMALYLNEFGIPYEFVVGEGDHSYSYWVTNFEDYFRWVAEDW